MLTIDSKMRKKWSKKVLHKAASLHHKYSLNL